MVESQGFGEKEQKKNVVKEKGKLDKGGNNGGRKKWWKENV